MLDEPYRWIEAINNRRDYIEDQLRMGSPVVGLRYDDGMLLLTIGRGQRKIFEVHDRIALAAMGHTADIERLRMLATDTASVQGFQSSVDDVTLYRLTNFVLGPTIKQAFEAIFGSAHIIKMLLTELGGQGQENQFISLNYDGTTRSSHRAEVIGGVEEVETAMRNYLSAADAADLSLPSALQLALETWAVGWDVSLNTEDADWTEENEKRSEKNAESESTIDKERVHEVLRKELKEGEIEAATLQASRRSNSKFRLVPAEEIKAVIADWL
jgi:proteasome alpha subunit